MKVNYLRADQVCQSNRGKKKPIVETPIPSSSENLQMYARKMPDLARLVAMVACADTPKPVAPPAITPVISPAPEVGERTPVKDRSLPPRFEPAPVSYYQPEIAPQVIVPEPEPPTETFSVFNEIDWATVGLALLALLAVGGLIPFWMMIYFAYNPPIRQMNRIFTTSSIVSLDFIKMRDEITTCDSATAEGIQLPARRNK